MIFLPTILQLIIINCFSTSCKENDHRKNDNQRKNDDHKENDDHSKDEAT